MKSVYNAVRTGSLNKAVRASSMKGLGVSVSDTLRVNLQLVNTRKNFSIGMKCTEFVYEAETSVAERYYYLLPCKMK